VRAFAAIPLPETFAAWLEACRKTIDLPSTAIRMVPAESCHITLRFLGDVPADQVPEMTQRLSEAFVEASEFQIILDRVGVFFRDGRPSVLWLGPKVASRALVDLAAAADRALSGFGLNGRAEHFTPHITIGRFLLTDHEPDVGSVLKKAVEPFPVQVSTVVLFESILGQARPLYIARSSVRLNDLPNKETELY